MEDNTSSYHDNTIAYQPYFSDLHNSNLAILFFNLEAAFLCLKDTNTTPACSLFSQEEDEFLGGRSLIQAADIIGNHFASLVMTTHLLRHLDLDLLDAAH